MAEGGLLGRLRDGLRKTRESLRGKLDGLLAGGDPGADPLPDLRDLLLASDLGPATAERIVEGVRGRLGRGALRDAGRLRGALQETIAALLEAAQSFAPTLGPAAPPFVTLVLGVNGSGKTTTIAKLAHRELAADRSVLLAAGDTFRAAGIEQLAVWARRVGAEVVAHQAGADPSAVIFDALRAARARAIDHVIIDTAGRLHTKRNLMEELKKMVRILGREVPGAPHETLLVLDATTGTNALVQARKFHEAVGVTGLILAKVDGTAKGGAVVAIAHELKLPVRYVGIGEGLEDLAPFDPQAFAAALLS